MKKSTCFRALLLVFAAASLVILNLHFGKSCSPFLRSQLYFLATFAVILSLFRSSINLRRGTMMFAVLWIVNIFISPEISSTSSYFWPAFLYFISSCVFLAVVNMKKFLGRFSSREE